MAPSPAQVPLIALARLSLLTLLWFPSATAQYRFDSWTTDNGLPQNSISSIIQTRDGYLWMTTFDGLVRFDGTTILTDRNGDVWVGSERGLFKFNEGRVVAYYTTKEGAPADDVKVIHEDRQGKLWMVNYRVEVLTSDSQELL